MGLEGPSVFPSCSGGFVNWRKAEACWCCSASWPGPGFWHGGGRVEKNLGGPWVLEVARQSVPAPSCATFWQTAPQPVRAGLHQPLARTGQEKAVKSEGALASVPGLRTEPIVSQPPRAPRPSLLLATQVAPVSVQTLSVLF